VEPVAHLCLAAREGGVIAAAIRHWPVQVGRHPALLLGPIAVHPTHQGEGLGGLLIRSAIERAAGWERILLVGDAPYYRRFGFFPLAGVTMPPPTNPDRVLGLALVAQGWEGVAGPVERWGSCPGGSASPSSPP
jgi:predicted N-acetyltransferase YhbS